MITLNELKVSQSATIVRVGGSGALRQHFLDMGVIPGEMISLIKFAPMGDPIEFRVQDYELTLRKEDALKIEIADVHPTSENKECPLPPLQKERSHPRLGEGKVLQDLSIENGLQKKLVFALVGNQNCGKTTLFNQLTGSNQHVGNFPGVTVDRKSGSIKGHPETEVVDLPGIYSLSPYTSEEIVSRRFILEEKPSAIINIVDATNIERNLYLTMQLLELDIPVILALNMMDEMRGNGGSIRINEMEELLQVPVVPISAAKNEGIDELIRHAIHIAREQELPGRTDFCEKTDHNGAVHRAIHGVMHLTEDHAKRAGIPPRFAASKLIENDPRVEKALALSSNETDMVEHIVTQMEEERELDRAASIAEMRFLFIRRLCAQTVVKPKQSKEHLRSARIDKLLTGKWTALPVFVLIMGGVFFLTFSVIGAFLQNLLEQGIASLSLLCDRGLTSLQVAGWVHSLIIDGIFNGVGTVVSFLPVIVTLFFFLSMLEDSGYMARIAFVTDKLLRRIGLSGRSIVPLLIGFGCTVPAVMSIRTLPSERDRRMTSLMIPFMSCSAKMPVYAFFCSAFFPDKAPLVMLLLYLLGIVMAVLIAFISKNTIFKGEAVPFVMELPNYRMPGLKNVLMLMWDKAKDFLQRAFTVIFIGTIVVWFLQTFSFSLNVVSDPSSSMLAKIAGAVSPIFRPLGFDDWRITTSIISGFMAKESIVSMLSVLYGSLSQLTNSLSTLSAASLLVFCLLYTPCIAAVSAIKREQGLRFALGTVLFQCTIAWVTAFAVHSIGLLITLL